MAAQSRFWTILPPATDTSIARGWCLLVLAKMVLPIIDCSGRSVDFSVQHLQQAMLKKMEERFEEQEEEG